MNDMKVTFMQANESGRQAERSDRVAKLYTEREVATASMDILQDYGPSEEVRYQKFRHNWPRTDEDQAVEGARRRAKNFWQKVESASSAQVP